MSLQIYGIPNCGTCKKALKWLDTKGVTYEFINTKESPPTSEMIREWVDSLTAKAMRNTSGASYRALGEQRNSFTDEQWINAFANDAMLLKRPIMVKEGTAVLVGFRAKEEAIAAALGI
ncbi:MAG: Spx/MgsR family RNA polymerase-binding regulatory protein [Cyanobacteria bacterium SBLK]|nr:Spx/MgsR family RNA polymerase-binding regulatory protein [Cyanobacteria bacterium SBLK]